VIDVLGELAAEFSKDFVLGLAIVAIRRTKAREIRYGLNIPNEHMR